MAFDVALIACPVMQFYCGTPMYLLSGVDIRAFRCNATGSGLWHALVQKYAGRRPGKVRRGCDRQAVIAIARADEGWLPLRSRHDKVGNLHARSPGERPQSGIGAAK